MYNSAEWKALEKTMRNGIIDGETPCCCYVENQAFFGEVIAEVVKGEGGRVVSHVSDCLLDMVVGLDREQRTKNLVLHYRHFFVHVENQARRQSMKIRAGKVLAGRIQLDDSSSLLLRIVGPASKPVEVPLVDNRRVVAVLFQSTVHVAYRLGRECHKRIFSTLGQQDVIRSMTELACIKGLCFDYSPRHVTDVGGPSDQHRRLAPELESHRSEIIRGGSHYCCADFGSTGIDQGIKGQSRESRTRLRATLKNGDFGLLEELCDQLGHQCRGSWRPFRCLQHAYVTGSENAGNGAECKCPGEIPGTDNSNHALGLKFNSGDRVGEGSFMQLRLDPFPQVNFVIVQSLNHR